MKRARSVDPDDAILPKSKVARHDFEWPIEMLEVEIMGHADWPTLLAMAMTCRQFYKTWPLHVMAFPPKVQPWNDVALARFIHLRALNLKHDTNITDASVSLLSNLTSLVLTSNGMISDAGVYLLTKLTSLVLNFNFTISDASVSLLTNLTCLDLRFNMTINPACLLMLTSLRNIVQ